MSQGVTEHQPAFRVSVQNFDGLTRCRGDDIAGPTGSSAGHVFCGSDDGDQIDGQASVDGGLSNAQYSGSPAHIEFHLVHGGRWLQRDATGIEGNALANQGDGCLIFFAAVIAQDDHLTRLVTALRDGHKGAHTEAEHFLFIQCRQRYRLVACHFACLSQQVSRRAHVGWFVAQILRQGQALIQRSAKLDGGAQCFLVACVGQ